MCRSCSDGGRRCNRVAGFTALESAQRNRSRNLRNVAEALASGDAQQAANAALHAHHAQQRLDAATRAHPPAPYLTYPPTGPHEDVRVSPSAAAGVIEKIEEHNRAAGERGKNPLAYEQSRTRHRIRDDDVVTVDETVTLRVYGDPADVETLRANLGDHPAQPERRVNTHAVIAAAMTAVRRDQGYRKSDGTPNSTPGQVAQFLADTPDGSVRQALAPTAEDLHNAQGVRSWIRAQAPSTEYMRNLKALAKEDYIDPRYAGLMASSVASYTRAEQSRRARMNAETTSSWFGMQNEHVVVPAKVEQVEVVTPPGHPDPRYQVSSRTRDGNLIKWVSSGPAEVQEGDEVTVAGTVREHDSVDEERRTVLSHCRLRVHAQ